MRSKTIILIVLALGCGLVASIGISQVLQRNQDQGPAEETAPIWIAMADIKNGDALSVQNLKLENWPKEKIPVGALTKLEQIDGKHTRATIYQGEVVLEKKLRGGKSNSDMIPPGFRLYTVLGDGLNSQGGLLQPGDRVDLIVYVNKSFGNIETGTKTILQDIKVFAINDQTSLPDEKSADSITAKTVTLLMTPSEAEKATLAGEVGKIRLVVRSPGDKLDPTPIGTKLSDLFTVEKTNRDVENIDQEPARKAKSPGLAAILSQVQQAVSTPTAAPIVEEAQSFPMQIIKGTEISTIEFKKQIDDDSRWENGSMTAAPPSQPASDSGSAASKEQPKKDAKGQGPDSKKNGPKSNDENGSSSGHA